MAELYRAAPAHALPCAVTKPYERTAFMKPRDSKTSHDAGQTTSVWMNVPRPKFGALTNDQETEVCIIGAGIAGLTTAYLLCEAGKAVVVLDDGPIGGGQTQRTTAHLASAIDDQFFEIERIHGEQ